MWAIFSPKVSLSVMETVIDFWAQTMSSSADGSNSFRDLVEFGGLYLGGPAPPGGLMAGLKGSQMPVVSEGSMLGGLVD